VLRDAYALGKRNSLARYCCPESGSQGLGGLEGREDTEASPLIDMNCVLAFGGSTKSGKTTIGRLLAREHGLRFASFGEYVRKVAIMGMKHPSLADVQAVGLSLVTNDLAGLCQAVLREAGFVRGEGLVVDGIRHVKAITMLKGILRDQSLRVVYLECARAIRCERGGFSLNELQRLDSHPVEAERLAVKNAADFVLDTSLLTPRESLTCIRDWTLLSCQQS